MLKLRDFYAYSAWCFETRPKLHAHFLFVGDSAVVERLRRGAFGETITIKPVYDLHGLVNGYQAKERTPQAGYGRGHQLGGRIKGSHKLEGGRPGQRARPCVKSRRPLPGSPEAKAASTTSAFTLAIDVRRLA